jgi:maleate cis-trans isomerase
MIHRLGMLVPSANIATEIDMNRVLPKNYQVHFARLKVGSVDEKGWREHDADVDYQTELLSGIKPAAIVVLQTAASFYGEPHYEQELVHRIERIASVPAYTTAFALGRAVKALNAKKVTLLSPYNHDLLMRGKCYFERNHGLDIVGADSFNMTDPDAINKLTPEPARKALAAHAQLKPDVMILAGGAYRIIDHIEAWEAEFGIPILTTNQAAAWACVQAVKGEEKIKGYGALLAQMPSIT